MQLDLHGSLTFHRDEVKNLKKNLNENGFIVLQDFFSKDLKKQISESYRRSKFLRKLFFHPSPFKGQQLKLGREQVGVGPVKKLLLFVLNSADFLRELSRVKGRKVSLAAPGRLYLINRANKGYIQWHNDLDGQRQYQIFVPLEFGHRKGGSLSVRLVGEPDSERKIVGIKFGDVVVVKLHRKWEHCIHPVDGPGDRAEYSCFLH